MKRRTSKLITLIMIFMIVATACGGTTGIGGLGSKASSHEEEEPQLKIEGKAYPLTITDYFGNVTELKVMPERIAVLAGTPLNIWYDLGGKSVCTSDIADNNLKLVPEHKDEMLSLPVVGEVYNLDMEAVIAQKPDLVITQAGVQSKQTQTLREMGIPVIATLTRSFDDVITLYRSFGQILGVSDLAEEKISAITERRQNVIDKAPKEGKKAVILYLTASSLSVKLDNSIAGDVANSLGIKNIASDLPPDTAGSENTPLDIEYIVEQDPDIVLVTSMISSNEEAVKTMTEHFTSNQAWQSVRAVAEGKVAYLPQQYYLYNAGPFYDEAVRYMACCVYPEIFGEVSEWYGK